jgi:hypothetical protein
MENNSIIQKAFNAGYLIEKYLPTLFKFLASGFMDRNSPFAKGFIAGGLEYDKEQELSRPLPLSPEERRGANQTPPLDSNVEPEDDLEL